MIIYKTTNLINGKFYVGKDSKNSPDYLGSGILIKAAIKKYGKDNFKKEILEEISLIENINIREIYWINELNATDRNIGYNITGGGEGGNTYANNPNYDNIITNLKKRRHTEETKKKISENNWQKKNTGPRMGIKWSEDQRSKFYEYLAKNGGAFKGGTHTEEAKQKIREAKVGTKHSEETKQKMREAKVGMVLKDYTCPHCEKQGKGNAMLGYHFNNCKNKKDE